MSTVLLIIHLFVTLALIGVVLIQRSEGGGLGIGSSQGMGAFMTGRGTANLLTRLTGILAAAFFALSLALAMLNRGTAGAGKSILDTLPPLPATQSAPAPSSSGIPSPPGSAPSPVPAETTPPTAPSTAPASGSAPATSAPAPAAPAGNGPSVPTN
jgi:preprotein translocase subunit SecG